MLEKDNVSPQETSRDEWSEVLYEPEEFGENLHEELGKLGIVDQ